MAGHYERWSVCGKVQEVGKEELIDYPCYRVLSGMGSVTDVWNGWHCGGIMAFLGSYFASFHPCIFFHVTYASRSGIGTVATCTACPT